jgi:hypothetical protein
VGVELTGGVTIVGTNDPPGVTNLDTVPNIYMHELGHVLGAIHPNDTSAVSRFEVSSGTTGVMCKTSCLGSSALPFGDEGDILTAEFFSPENKDRVLNLDYDSAIAIVIAAVLTAGLISGIGVFLALSGGGGGAEHAVNCDRIDGLRVEWLISDNITGYEDIPESQKQNLSDDTREALDGMSSYNITDPRYTKYTDLSSAQKDLFRESLNNTETAVTENESKTPPLRIIYRGEAYFCDTDSYVPGA